MAVVYRSLFAAMWGSWCLYWLWGSRRVKLNQRREPLVSRLLHVIPLTLTAWLLASNRPSIPFLNERLFPWAPWQFWAGAVLTALGLAFTVWARIHLGRNWSGVVTIKQDHELIDTGPYALVRHPIYTGLLLAFVGSALARGEWRGVIAVLFAWAAFWRKLGVEERWLIEHFGERYVDYRRHVPALLPF